MSFYPHSLCVFEPLSLGVKNSGYCAVLPKFLPTSTKSTRLITPSPFKSAWVGMSGVQHREVQGESCAAAVEDRSRIQAAGIKENGKPLHINSQFPTYDQSTTQEITTAMGNFFFIFTSIN
jgi:hypothetical protein